MNLGSVLGHERIKAVLAGGLRAGRLPPTILLAGPEGVGKRTLALAVARALLCERGAEGDACGACSHCRRIGRSLDSLPELRRLAEERGEPERRNFLLHPDLVLAEPRRTATRAEILVDQVRGLLRVIDGRPFEARARAIVVDDAHALNDQAANALLKSLEEPPPTSHVLLVTASPEGLLPTIRSRCQLLRLGPLPAGLLEAHLRERLGLSPEQARLRAALAAGSLGAALAFESEAFAGLREELLALLESLGSLGPLERMEAAERLEQAEDAALALSALRSLLRDLAALATGAPASTLLNADVAPRLEPLARGPLGARAAALAEAAGETRAALRGYANRLLAMDLLVEHLAGPA